MRLVTFGCSVTYGQYLPDTTWKKDKDITPPSKLAWPAILGKALNIPVYNNAIPGIGNYLITDQITNFKLEENDIVIVMWTYKDRYDIIYNKRYNNLRLRKTGYEKLYETIGPWIESRKSTTVFRYLYNDVDALIRNQHYINYARLYLDTFNIKHFHTSCYTEDYKNVNDINVSKLRKIDTALDDLHPGPKSHIAIADAMYNYIKEKI